MSTLIFEGAGWDDTSVTSGVGNCRIRTRLRNDVGRIIFLEMGGNVWRGKKVPDIAKGLNVYGYITACFYDDSEWDSRRNSSSGFNFAQLRFEYCPSEIVRIVNENLQCSFADMVVINDGSVRVHDTSEPLCASSVGDFEPYADDSVYINVLKDVTPLREYKCVRMANYQISYDFVCSVPYINNWMNDRFERERSQFPNYRYFVTVRWDETGKIIDADISANQNFATFGIGLDALHQVVDEIISQNVLI